MFSPMEPKHHIIITSPELNSPAEAQWISTLLSFGIGRVHIRKPHATAEELVPLLEAIPQPLRHRCILSQHDDLVRRYRLGGLHLSVRSWQALNQRPDLEIGQTVSVSCHSAEELAQLPFLPDYAYLSPVAASQSKPGYGGNVWSFSELQKICAQAPCPLVALGGIHPTNAHQFLQLGFLAVASLGYWQGLKIHELDGAVQRMCQPRILLCGGVDPTSEAGVTADVRYAERLGAQCYTITTAVTYQNAQKFSGFMEMTDEQIKSQLAVLEQQAAPDVVKIGLITSLQQFNVICHHVRKCYPHSLIVWDPILRTSSGYNFLADVDVIALQEAAASVDILLPNGYERKQILGEFTPEKAARRWQTTIICKGDFQTADAIIDRAYHPDGSISESLYPPIGQDRHGTGCLYGTTLAFELANGSHLQFAMSVAQRAVAHYRNHQALPTNPQSPLGTPLVHHPCLLHRRGATTGRSRAISRSCRHRAVAHEGRLKVTDASYRPRNPSALPQLRSAPPHQRPR